jgi:hypothetical protein
VSFWCAGTTMAPAHRRRSREGIRSLHRSDQGRRLWRPGSNAILRLEQERVCASVEKAPRATCSRAAQRRAYGFPGFCQRPRSRPEIAIHLLT